MEKDEPHSNSRIWTWDDTLKRLQYIDTIINQIVNGAILLNVGLFAAFGGLNILLNSAGFASENREVVRNVMILIQVVPILVPRSEELNILIISCRSNQPHIS
jgi:hypothetical protein